MSSTDAQSEEVRAANKTVLIIEDDASIGACLVQAVVEETPYLAFFVTDSLDALRVLEDLKPDLLVIDYRLPHMNGIDLYDHIHAQKELDDIPCIVISAELPQQETQKRLDPLLSLFSSPFALRVGHAATAARRSYLLGLLLCARGWMDGAL